MLSSPAWIWSGLVPLRLMASKMKVIASIESQANCGGQVPLAVWKGWAKSSISFLNLLEEGTFWPSTPSVACT